DDNALVEHAIENVDETGPALLPFNCHSLLLLSGARRRLPFTARWPPGRERFDLALELLYLRLQLLGPELAATMASRRQVAVVAPPVETDLLRLVQRADEQPDADGEKLDFGEGDLDVARDHQSLVQ